MCNTEEQNSQLEATYYFLNFLEKFDAVLIPKIQRDYVQGGKNEKAEDIRNAFVEDLCAAVKGEKDLLLDFIYGVVEKGGSKKMFFPLDGQQRLTTLFLLHWYGSLFASKGKEIREQLKKFSYQTRFSSEQFCKLLFKDSVIKNILSDGAVPVSSVITDDPGYSKFWKYDPTVDSMLTMLDCIQEKAKEINWDEKIENLSKIKFIKFEIENSQEPDDLYVKMNARGKHLTNFENMKAHLQQWMTPSEELPENFKKDWQKKMDAEWSEFFWKHKDTAATDNSKKNPDPAQDFIDAPFWVFLNRLSLWGYITKKKNLLEPLRKKANERSEHEEKIAAAFSNALSTLSMPAKDTYVSPSMQKEIFAGNTAMYKIVSHTLNLIAEAKIELLKTLYPLWDQAEKSFREFFWKDGRDGNSLNARIQIFAFAAFCNSFCNNSELNKEHLKHWMQFIHQVCANLGDEQAFAGAATMIMICLEAMGKQSDVYAYLAEKYEELFNKKEDSTLPLAKWHFSIKEPVGRQNPDSNETIYGRLFQKNALSDNANPISFQWEAIWNEALKCYLRCKKDDQNNNWNSLLEKIEGNERLHGHIQSFISEDDSDEELFDNTQKRFENLKDDYFSAPDEQFVELLQLTTKPSLKVKFDFSSYAKWHINVVRNPTIAGAMCKFLSGERAEGAIEWQKMLKNTKELITEWKPSALEPYRKDGLMHLVKGGNIASGSILLNPAVHETIESILEDEEIKTFTQDFNPETIGGKTFYICKSSECVLGTITHKDRSVEFKRTGVVLPSSDGNNYKQENLCDEIKKYLRGESETPEQSESVSVAEEQNL